MPCKAALALTLALTLAAPVFAQDAAVVYTPDPPEGYPWVLGQGTVTLDGTARSYTTYDFSLGAFDAAVQFRADVDCSGRGACKETGRVLLALRAHPDANPKARADVVVIGATFDKLPAAPRKTRKVTVEIREPGGDAGALWRSKPGAVLRLTAVRRGRDGSDSYGTLSATVSATVCEATEDALVPGGACHAFEAVFDTAVQYDSL